MPFVKAVLFEALRSQGTAPSGDLSYEMRAWTIADDEDPGYISFIVHVTIVFDSFQMLVYNSNQATMDGAIGVAIQCTFFKQAAHSQGFAADARPPEMLVQAVDATPLQVRLSQTDAVSRAVRLAMFLTRRTMLVSVALMFTNDALAGYAKSSAAMLEDAMVNITERRATGGDAKPSIKDTDATERAAPKLVKAVVSMPEAYKTGATPSDVRQSLLWSALDAWDASQVCPLTSAEAAPACLNGMLGLVSDEFAKQLSRMVQADRRLREAGVGGVRRTSLMLAHCAMCAGGTSMRVHIQVSIAVLLNIGTSAQFEAADDAVAKYVQPKTRAGSIASVVARVFLGTSAIVAQAQPLLQTEVGMDVVVPLVLSHVAASDLPVLYGDKAVAGILVRPDPRHTRIAFANTAILNSMVQRALETSLMQFLATPTVAIVAMRA